MGQADRNPPYEARSVQVLPQVDAQGWQFKIYGMTLPSKALSNALYTAAVDVFADYLPQPATTTMRFGVGFMIIHQAENRNSIFLAWWENGCVLHQRMLFSSQDAPLIIQPDPNDTVIGCVHELNVINFESDAWMRTMMHIDVDPDLDDYLKQSYVP